MNTLKEKILELYAKGWYDSKIAKKLKISTTTIYNNTTVKERKVARNRYETIIRGIFES